MVKNPDKIKQGKHNRAAGKRFENKVREDLENKGWIVVRWDKNVEFEDFATPDNKYGGVGRHGKLIQSKPKFNPFTKSLMMNSPGFPDFVCFSKITNDFLYTSHNFEIPSYFIVQFVECKINGTLDKKEKEKIDWIKSVLKIPVYVAHYDYPEENINVPSIKRKKKEIIYEEVKNG